MRDLAGTLLADKDLTKMSSDEVKNVAGALPGLSPNDLDKLPQDAILKALSTIKNTKNMNKKQVRKSWSYFQPPIPEGMCKPLCLQYVW